MKHYKTMDKHHCKHLTSCREQECAAGVRYDYVTIRPNEPGSAFRKACRLPEAWDEFPSLRAKAHGAERGTCDKFCLPTDAEVEAYENDLDERIRKTLTVATEVAKLKKQHGRTDWAGNIKCPVCGDRMSVSIAGSINGHAYVRCWNDNCVRYME